MKLYGHQILSRRIRRCFAVSVISPGMGKLSVKYTIYAYVNIPRQKGNVTHNHSLVLHNYQV